MIIMDNETSKWIIEIRGLFPEDQIDSFGKKYTTMVSGSRDITFHGTESEMNTYCKFLISPTNQHVIMGAYRESDTLVEFRINTDIMGNEIPGQIKAMDIFNGNKSIIISKNDIPLLVNENEIHKFIQALRIDSPKRIFIDKVKFNNIVKRQQANES